LEEPSIAKHALWSTAQNAGFAKIWTFVQCFFDGSQIKELARGLPSLCALRSSVHWTNQNKAKKQDKQALSVLAAPIQAVIWRYFQPEQTLSISSSNGIFTHVGWIS
jgi:hypothetical protein